MQMDAGVEPMSEQKNEAQRVPAENGTSHAPLISAKPPSVGSHHTPSSGTPSSGTCVCISLYSDNFIYSNKQCTIIKTFCLFENILNIFLNVF